MPKLDLYQKYRAEYVTPKNPTLLDIGPARYLAIDGRGKPGGAEFGADVGALYGMAFTVKMARKFAGKDYAVAKLEGLWRPVGKTWTPAPKELIWKLMIRVPEFLTKADLRTAIEKLRAKGRDAGAERVALEKLEEGTCVQVLHVGPYDAERETIARMKAFAAEQGLAFAGLHHEIYLSDPRRVAPAKLKTILRQPVRRAKRRS